MYAHTVKYQKYIPPPPPPLRPQPQKRLMFKRAHANDGLNLFSISGKQMVPIHDDEKRYAEARAITNIRTFTT